VRTETTIRRQLRGSAKRRIKDTRRRNITSGALTTTDTACPSTRQRPRSGIEKAVLTQRSWATQKRSTASAACIAKAKAFRWTTQPDSSGTAGPRNKATSEPSFYVVYLGLRIEGPGRRAKQWSLLITFSNSVFVIPRPLVKPPRQLPRPYRLSPLAQLCPSVAAARV
jgi:hypothetical protein